MKPLRPVLLALLLAGLACLPPPRPAPACAPIPPKGGYVFTAEESALVVWDEEAKTEHFIRRATFDTEAADFGFLVPTPTQPRLGEAGDASFAMMEEWTKPEVVERVEYRPRDRGLPGAAADAAPKSAVEVLDRQRVGGFDAVVLKASDPRELNDWLEKNGYHAGPAVAEWLKPYVEQEWILTAFKIAKQGQAGSQVATSAVVMSFTTEKPFFPYSEPTSQRSEAHRFHDRLLRVFFVGSARVKGSLPEGQPAWPGKTAWAGKLSDDQTNQLREQLAAAKVEVKEGNWLTVLEDNASPRPGTADLFFSHDEDQSPVKRPPIVRVVYRDAPEDPVDVWRWGMVGGGAVAGIVALAFLGWWLSTRRAGV